GTGLSIDDSEDDKITIEIDETDMEDGKTYGYQPTEGWSEIQKSPDLDVGTGLSIDDSEDDKITIEIDETDMEDGKTYGYQPTEGWTEIQESESADLDVGTGLSIDDSEDDKITIEIDETDMEDGKTYGYQPTEGWTEIQESESADLDVGTGLSIDDSEDDKITIEIDETDMEAGSKYGYTPGDGWTKITEGGGETNKAYSNVTVVVPSESGPVETEIPSTTAEDTIKFAAGSNITLTPDVVNKTVTITANVDAPTNLTVSAGTGIKVTPTTDAGTTDYKVALGYELGYIGGTVQDLPITQTNQNLLEDVSIADVIMTNDVRFLIRNNRLYALATEEGVDGVDMFTMSFNGTLTRTPVDGYHFLNKIDIKREGASNSLVEGAEYYPSQTGLSFVSISTTVKNSSTNPVAIEGPDGKTRNYFGYELIYSGDEPYVDETGMVMTYRITAVEETIGIADTTSGTGGDGKISFNGEPPAYWGDKIESVYPISANSMNGQNKIEVKLTSGTGKTKGMVMSLVEDSSGGISADWVEPTGGGVEGCDGEVRISDDDDTMGYLSSKIVQGFGIKFDTVDIPQSSGGGKRIVISSDTDDESTVTPATPFPQVISNLKLNFTTDDDITYGGEVTQNWGVGSHAMGSDQACTNVAVFPINLPSGRIQNISIMPTKDPSSANSPLYASFVFYGAAVSDFTKAVPWGQISWVEYDRTSGVFDLNLSESSAMHYIKYKTNINDEWDSASLSTSLNGMPLAGKGLFNWVAVAFSGNGTEFGFSIAGYKLSPILISGESYKPARGIGYIGNPSSCGFYLDGRLVNAGSITNVQGWSFIPFIQLNIVRDETTDADHSKGV
ncbi:MAG: hypothetical protein MJZ25_12985, partial [Fibrobacter sp.]|nr:hypothetical protein [Fibrobacter sp.]